MYLLHIPSRDTVSIKGNRWQVDIPFCHKQGKDKLNLECYYEPWTNCTIQDALGEDDGDDDVDVDDGYETGSDDNDSDEDDDDDDGDNDTNGYDTGSDVDYNDETDCDNFV